MVSGSNEQCSRCHGKENQDLCQIKEVVECRHQREKKDGRERAKEEAAQAKAELLKLIRRSRRERWSDYSKNRRGAEE